MYKIGNTNDFFPVRGVSQSKRENLALNPSYFKIDDRSFGDHVNFLVEYSKSLSFFNEQNRYEGSWEEFFANDPTIKLVQLLNIDISGLQEEFNNSFVAVSYTHLTLPTTPYV